MFRYDATIEALTPNGYYVSYDEWGNKEEVYLSPQFQIIGVFVLVASIYLDHC